MKQNSNNDAAPSLPPPRPDPSTSISPISRSRSGSNVPSAGGIALGERPNSSLADVAAYTLTNGLTGQSRSRGNSSANTRPSTGSKLVINDSRFRFQNDDQLPAPRAFSGSQKRYRAGRGSSVPLDLASL